jgi:hypothetical protein
LDWEIDMSNHTIPVDYEDLTFDVEFDYYPASKGAREKGSGVQLEPDEPASWDICTIKLRNGKIRPLDVTDWMNEIMMGYFEEEVRDVVSGEGENPFDLGGGSLGLDDEPRFGLDDDLYRST